MAAYMVYAYLWNTESYLRPYIAADLHLDRTQAAALYTSQAFGALLGALLLAPYADRHGYRNALIIIALGAGFSALASAWVSSYSALLTQRIVMGFFLGGVFGCTVSAYVDRFPPRQYGFLSGLVQLVYNGGDAALSWFGRLLVESNWRYVMVGGGIADLIAAAAIAFLVFGGQSAGSRLPACKTSVGGGARSSITELFNAGRWGITLRLIALCSLNFVAFQSFNGWLSTYLRDVQHFAAPEVGRLITIMHGGSMLGALVWGFVADRQGRRQGAIAFLASAALVALYLASPVSVLILSALGFSYGFCFVASGTWGPYFAELYPSHLRATAASIFHWGRAVSSVGALLSGALAQSLGLEMAMSIATLAFASAAIVWWTLPETLVRPDPQPT
jgi:MFS family permease